MWGCAPRTILTDQCQAMRAVIKTELPSARHRWCKWHVLRKAKESLGGTYRKDDEFKATLDHLLNEIVSVDEFEMKWKDMVSKYGLQKNECITRAYQNRVMWARPYFGGIFCAGMTSTQRSESANHMLKAYIPRAAPIHLFLSQYNKLISDREEEGRAGHATKQLTRYLRVGGPLEKHAVMYYTKAMFDKFSYELYKSSSPWCREERKGCVFVVSRLSRNEIFQRCCPEYMVSRVEDTIGRYKFECECKGFEHSGMPCRHILKVLVHTSEVVIPDPLLCKRWS